jgi:His-Xaa-Ser system radical SAM maturase HxsC
MLRLFGVAQGSRAFDTDRAWEALRLCSPASEQQEEADVALARCSHDFELASKSGFRRAVAVGTDAGEPNNESIGLLRLPPEFSYLAEGDILGYQPKHRRFRTLYRSGSKHNSFLVTERCNHYCLMCSQPPRDVDDGWLLDEIDAALTLIDPHTRSFTFTGGEPLTEWKRFIGLLEKCRATLPKTAIHVLTNGRAFARTETTKAWADIRHPNLMAGIPIYSAVDHIHDYVVQSQGAFNETVLGILKLKNAGQRLEIRVVLHAITAPRIVETCRWIARNLPFADHVALMGLENTGFTLANDSILWMDPVDYAMELARAVETLAAAKVPVSIYNLPRCVLPREIWPYALQSISDWKNGYWDECEKCVERVRCAGIFTSGRPRRSRGIAPILAA